MVNSGGQVDMSENLLDMLTKAFIMAKFKLCKDLTKVTTLCGN